MSEYITNKVKMVTYILWNGWMNGLNDMVWNGEVQYYVCPCLYAVRHA